MKTKTLIRIICFLLLSWWVIDYCSEDYRSFRQREPDYKGLYLKANGDLIRHKRTHHCVEL